MKAIKLTKERMAELLPDNVKNSTVMSEPAKRVLAALLNHYIITPKASENNTLTIPNNTLRASVGIRQNRMLEAVQELIELNLVVRVRGKKRTAGEKAMASEYRFNIENIMSKPIVKPTAEQLLSKVFNVAGTAYTNTNTDSNSDTDSYTDSESNTESDTDTYSLSDTDSKENTYKNDLLNIIDNNKINIIDNITVCGDEPQATESITNDKNNLTMNYTLDKPAYAKTIEDFFNELKIASTVSEVNRAFVGASRLIEETDINGRLTLLQAVANAIKRNNVSFKDLETMKPDEKVVRLEELFTTPIQPKELLRRIDRINPLITQLTCGLRRLNRELIPRETSAIWWHNLKNSKAMVTTSADTSVLRLF